MVCLLMCLTKRRIATLPWKTRIRLPKISKSQLIRSFLQLQGSVTQCNGVFAGQNGKLEMHYYILCQGAQQLPACNGKTTPNTTPQKDPKRERPLFLPSHLARESLRIVRPAPPCVRNHAPVLSQEPRAPCSRRGSG